MLFMLIKIVNTSNNPDPTYATAHAAGMDIRAFVDAPVTILPMQRTLIPTGLFIELPEGYEAQIRPRSGLAINSGITMLNTPGTIDADYRGEIKVIVINLGDAPFIVNSGDRIAQMVIAKYESVTWVNTDKLSESERGAGGFGHTG
ncbi:MAG TPA: dUTP diphosphatase [Chitinophagales bacterium]|nr:dUTP diphosphatase [Chitinophagales bacterium]HMU68932.1 dUTP diphosphatase [Chitinophagales bacterium]HMX05222.1 dUTP diphosphatase [Chitinophagales bacterium]HMZ87838.1 dUTP diphosphatase [Chitinophagales bacterium]HNA57284.1 dUTP diphosphatase [Chitinophagales bacterium]